ESFWFSRQDAAGPAVVAVDAGAIYELGARYALDGGMQFGISGSAPDLAAFGGVSIIVGDILGAHGVHARQRKAQGRAARKPKGQQPVIRCRVATRDFIRPFCYPLTLGP